MARMKVSKDQRIVQMEIDPHKNFGGNTITAIRRMKKNNQWKINKVASSRTKLRMIQYEDRTVSHPFEQRVLSVYDYERLPNFLNPNFFGLLEKAWANVIPDYIDTLQREGVDKKRLKQIKENCEYLHVNSYFAATGVLELMGKIKYLGPDKVERRMFNPEEIAGLIDRCDKATLFGEEPYATHSVEFRAEWYKALYESGGRPYTEDVSWEDVEAAIKNGF